RPCSSAGVDRRSRIPRRPRRLIPNTATTIRIIAIWSYHLLFSSRQGCYSFSQAGWGGETEPLLRVRGLNAWYGDSHVLHGIDFDVGEINVVTLVGRNGAGKTSPVRSIMGLLDRRNSSVRFFRQRDHCAV